MRLTARALLLLVLLAVVAGVDLWQSSPLGLWRWALLLTFALLVLEAVHARQRSLSLRVATPATLRLGLPARFDLCIANDDGQPLRGRHRLLAPPGLSVRSGDRTLAVPPGESTTLTADVVPERLGPGVLGDQWVEVRGLAGLAHWVRRVDLQLPFTVQPLLARDRSALPGIRGSAARSRGRAGEGTELLDLRPYRDGDPARRIDWKATARSGRPVVRQYEQDESLDVLLVVDAGLGAGVQQGVLTRYGHACNVAARLAELAIGCGDRVGLLVFADQVLVRLPPARGTAQLAAMRTALARHDALGRESNPLEAMLAARRLVRHRALVVVFSDLDDPDGSEQLVAATGLLRPKHQPMIAAFRDPESEALARRPADDWRDPWYAIAARDVERDARVRRERLRRLGAQVLHARAEDMDGSVRDRYLALRRARRV